MKSPIPTWLAALVLGVGALTAGGRAAVAEHDLNAYVGRWSLHRDKGAGWIELSRAGEGLGGSLLWGEGSVLPLEEVAVNDDHIVVARPIPPQAHRGETTAAEGRWALRHEGGELKGRVLSPGGDGGEHFIGRRLSAEPAPDVASLRYGEPIRLFNGRDLDGWELIGDPDGRVVNGFHVVDGALVSQPPAAHTLSQVAYGNIKTTRVFDDFRLRLEVKLPAGSNSGVFLRGVYEIQVKDTYGQKPDPHGMGALYSRIAPSRSAEKPAGEWQSLEMLLCNRHITVELNGQTIIDNQPVQGVTGGALTADEESPGPICLQGDHGVVTYRNLVLRPVLTGG